MKLVHRLMKLLKEYKYSITAILISTIVLFTTFDSAKNYDQRFLANSFSRFYLCDNNLTYASWLELAKEESIKKNFPEIHKIVSEISRKHDRQCALANKELCEAEFLQQLIQLQQNIIVQIKSQCLRARLNRAAPETASSDPALPSGPSGAQKIIIHYNRIKADYAGWLPILSWKKNGIKRIKRDKFGNIYEMELKDITANTQVNLQFTNGATLDHAGYFFSLTPEKNPEIWILQNEFAVFKNEAAAQHAAKTRLPAEVFIRYFRADGKYEGWGLHIWSDGDEITTWSQPLYGKTYKDEIYFKLNVRDYGIVDELKFVIHKGPLKDSNSDFTWNIRKHSQILIRSGSSKPEFPVNGKDFLEEVGQL